MSVHDAANISDPVIAELIKMNREKILPSDKCFLVAVSGGGDSAALLHSLAKTADFLNIKDLKAAHIDHGLRKNSSVQASATAELSASLGIDCEIMKVNVGSEGGLQASARLERYRALELVRERIGADYILTAHTSNDQAETLIMRIARGTSPGGLSGIRTISNRLVRPFLGLSRSELIEYCKRWDIPYFSDPANKDSRFMRTRVRHEIIPLMEKLLGPGIIPSLCRLAEAAEKENAVLEKLAQKLEKNTYIHPWGYHVGRLAEAEEALVRRMLAGAWRNTVETLEKDLSTPVPVDRTHLDRLYSLLQKSGSARQELPGKIIADISCGFLNFGRLPWPVLEEIHIEGPGNYSLGPAGDLSVRVADEEAFSRKCIGESRQRGLFPSSLAPFTVRGRRPGDRIEVNGRKLSDFLNRKRIPRSLRGRIPILFGGKLPLWVMGVVKAPAPASFEDCYEFELNPASTLNLRET